MYVFHALWFAYLLFIGYALSRYIQITRVVVTYDRRDDEFIACSTLHFVPGA